MTEHTVPAVRILELKAHARTLRKNIIIMTTEAGSGHPGPALSLVEIITALYFSEMRYDPTRPEMMGRDRFVLSKGHGAPALYGALVAAGFVSADEMQRFRHADGLLAGHPCIKTPGVDACSGSLGTGLSIACGMAQGAKMRGSGARVFAVVGDGESDEGQIWEAALFAAHHGLDNLVVFTDRNKLQYSGKTSDVLRLEPLADKWRAFGWAVWEIDGHDLEAILRSLEEARGIAGQPKMIIAHTVKGKGISFMEGSQKYHGKPTTAEEGRRALLELEEKPL
jgi:transketolase